MNAGTYLRMMYVVKNAKIMKSKKQINEEAKEIYFAIKRIMELSETDYCQSWWLNTRNFKLMSDLKTPQITQRAKLLVKQGYLIIDKARTSTSTGTCYKLTDKPLK
jgi:hypothetical protein